MTGPDRDTSPLEPGDEPPPGLPDHVPDGDVTLDDPDEPAEPAAPTDPEAPE